MTEDTASTGRAQAFSDRVFTLFATSVFTTGLGIVIGFVLAVVLGPAGKGDFYLITLLPVTIVVLIQFGLPTALGYYAARSQTLGINLKTLVLTVALSVPALLIVGGFLALFGHSTLAFLDPTELILGLAVLPFALSTTLSTGVLLGRQAVRPYAVINIGQSLCSIFLFILFVGVMDLGLIGALWAFLLVYCISAAGLLFGSIRVSAVVEAPRPVSYRELFRYGLPFYPGSLTQFFSLRVDIYLLAWLVPSPSAPIGLYSMAVTMASLVFFLPNAVSTLFFPHVAGSARDDSDRQVAMVARVTLLVTAAVAVALAPFATVLINLLLPAFVGSLPSLYVMLPAVVALSLTKVLSSYVAGLGLSGWTSVVNVGALVLNIVANLILIPLFGIVGAAAASLISYGLSAIAFTAMATRLSGTSWLAFWVPRRSDLSFTIGTVVSMGRRLMGRAATVG
jgi:O-antigen/teichoic acid export membrane protein